jgi:hypothetical protein
VTSVACTPPDAGVFVACRGDFFLRVGVRSEISSILLQDRGVTLKLFCQQNEDPIDPPGTGSRDARCLPSERGLPAKLLRLSDSLALSWISHRPSRQ